MAPAAVIAAMLPTMAGAANYSASNETQLRQAVDTANADADPSATITLSADIVLADPTAISAATKPITLDTGAFSLTASAAGAGVTAAGASNTLGGGTFVLSGNFIGGAAASANSRGAGGNGISMTGGTLSNGAAVIGGQGGNTNVNSTAGRIAGTGGSGMNLTGTQLVNDAGASITGGTGGTYDALNVIGSSVSASPGAGGAGVTITNGGLDNQGTITGGVGGSAIDAPGNADNIFSLPGGTGAVLTGGSHTNSGTIMGGAGGAGFNQGGSGNGAGGVGLALTNGSLVNDGTIAGADGRVGGGSVAGSGSVGGFGATLSASTLENDADGVVRGGGTGGTAGGATGGSSAITAAASTVINGGTIIGGLDADKTTHGNAIAFTGGNNMLELLSGSTITGSVTATAGDTLALGGTVNDTFDVSQIGAAASTAQQYRGFTQFDKLGTSIWTLMNTPVVVTPWTLTGGELSVGSDANLGAVSGALTFNGGTLQVTGTAFTATTRTINWGAGGGGFDIADSAHVFTVSQSLTTGGQLSKLGAGTLALTGTNTYTGGTTIVAGTLQLGDGNMTGSITGNVADNGTLAFNRSDTVTFDGVISGTGALTQVNTGTTILTGDNTYTGGTTIALGTLQLGDGNTSGGILGNVADNGALVFNRSNTVAMAGVISGSGTVNQAGGGTTVLSGANSYTGTTDVSQGTLVIDGNQAAATGAVTVHTDATLAGSGTTGGAVTVQPGAAIAPGNASTGTLTMGSLTLDPGSSLNFDLGARGVVAGQLNDLIVVKGNLNLDGAVNVAQTPGGTFDPGLYRLINYTGMLTGNTLDVGTVPVGSNPADITVQTSVAQQVNLVNTSGLALRYWDGAAIAGHDNGVFNGGVGSWMANGDANWTDSDPAVNGAWADNAFAVFMGAPATVTVDNSAGPISFSGAQFVVDGYTIDGPGELTTTTAQTIIRVGDGTSAGASMTATIDAAITGSGGIVKSDLGTLILNGANTYSGGTTLGAGTLQISQDTNLGAAAGGLVFDGGTLSFAQAMTTARTVNFLSGGAIDTQANDVTLAGALSGSGNWSKQGAGTLTLTGGNASTGTATIAAGILRAGAANVFGPDASYAVSAGATLDTAGLAQTVAGLTNAGTVSLVGTVPGTVLTVHGNYVGQNGVLQMATALGADSSPADRLVIDGGHASGQTTVQVVNVGGLGAQTTGNGIELISAINGATTTAQATHDAFSLAGGQVDAGAFEYRLLPGDASGAGENWYLRSSLPTPPTAPRGDSGDPGTSPGTSVVTYRPEVALNAAIPAVLAQGDLNMLGTLHQRVGDAAYGPALDSDGLGGRVWTRVIDQDDSIQQRGTVAPRAEGWTSGTQLGADILAGRKNRIGAYGGNLSWGSQVSGYASGVDNLPVGSLHGHTNNAGLYWTHTGDTGWYSDAVLQQGWQNGKAQAVTGSETDIRGHSTLASIEVGKPYALTERWAVEPQAQIIAGKQHLNDASIAAADFEQDTGTDVTGRLGFRVLGDFQTNQGRTQPYARFNVWHGFSGTGDMSVGSPVGNTSIDTDRGYTAGEVAVGGTWTLTQRISLYGEVGHMFPMGGGQRISAEHTISAGIRVAW